MTDRGTVLVTGASSFLGRYTVRALETAGWRVLTSGRSQAADRNVDVLLDIARPQDVMLSLKPLQVDAIVHLAARIGWPDKTSAELFAPNVLATGCLAEIARVKGAMLIVASAAIVHGVRNSSITPAGPEAADTPYGLSKLLGDKLVQASGSRYCIFRFGGLFGRHGPTHLGLNKAISGILAGEPPLVVGRGSARRNYLYVKDAAAAVVAALEASLEGVHLYAGSQALTIREMLESACDILAPGLRPVIQDGPEATDQFIEPSLALPPSRSFADALRDIGSDQLQCA